MGKFRQTSCGSVEINLDYGELKNYFEILEIKSFEEFEELLEKLAVIHLQHFQTTFDVKWCLSRMVEFRLNPQPEMFGFTKKGEEIPLPVWRDESE